MINVSKGLRLGLVELRRSFRSFRRNRRQSIVLLLSVGFVLSNLVWRADRIRTIGRSVGGAPTSVVPVLGQLVVAAVAVAAGVVAVRTVETLLRPDCRTFLFTSIPTDTIVFGILTGELLRLLALVSVPATVSLAMFALGVGTPAILLSVALGAVPLLLFGLLGGFFVAVLLLSLFSGPDTSRSLAVATILLVFVLAAATVVPLPEVLSVGAEYYATALLVGLPTVELTPPVAASPVVLTASLIPLFAASSRLAESYWMADGAETSSSLTTSRGREFPTLVGRTETRRVAWRLWRRRLRSRLKFVTGLLPAAFLFCGPMLFVVGLGGVELLAAIAGPLLSLAGVWLSGGLFGLNPLGDEADALPYVLTTPNYDETLVQARALSGLAAGLPVVVFGAVVAGIGRSFVPMTALSSAAIGLYLAGCASLVGLGFGALFPSFERSEAFGRGEIVQPSTVARVGYTITIAALYVASQLLVVFPRLLDAALGLRGAHRLSLPLFVVGVGLLGVASYRYAVSRFRSYTYE